MRNAPVDAEEKPAFLLGGHTISKVLPWYRGNVSGPESMEAETKALVALVERGPTVSDDLVDGSLERGIAPRRIGRGQLPHHGRTRDPTERDLVLLEKATAVVPVE